MIIKITTIKDPNIAENERLILIALKDGQLGEYGIFRSRLIEKGSSSVSSVVRQTFWFPDKQVKSGDLIVLYTKGGKPNESKNNDGSTSYFFYWGLEKPIWSSPLASAVLFHIDDWTSCSVSLLDRVPAEPPSPPKPA